MPLRRPVVVLLAALLLGAFLSWDLISSAFREAGAPQQAVSNRGPRTLRERPVGDPLQLIAAGERVFDAQCAQCHGPRADWPMPARLKGRTRDELHALLDHLPLVNPAMPGFHGTDEERLALAAYLASLEGAGDRVPVTGVQP